ncbi:MAG: hypothetical protein KF799_03145 [Bdellovibrionales bacterium]|nr:hypothetical protein [Bdellovibrionales bacterium]
MILILAFLMPAELLATEVSCRKHVRSSTDFQAAIVRHISRVEALGIALFEQFPAEFRGLNSVIISRYLKLHDSSKTEPKLLRQLYTYYGMSLDEQCPSEKAAMLAVIREHNAREREISQAFFAAEGLLDPQGHPLPAAKRLVLVERIADLVDRGQDPKVAEEFNRPMQPASQFLDKEKHRHMARYLEENYTHLVGESSCQEALTATFRSVAD